MGYVLELQRTQNPVKKSEREPDFYEFKFICFSHRFFLQCGAAAVYLPPPLAALGGHFSTQAASGFVRLYPGNRRAGDAASAETGAETIPPPVPLNTKKYKPKQRQAPSLTNLLAIASTMGFQRDESLWAYPPTPTLTQQPCSTESKSPPKGASGLSSFTRTCPGYLGNRRAGDTASAETGSETIPPPVPLNTERYQPKQRQALSLFSLSNENHPNPQKVASAAEAS